MGPHDRGISAYTHGGLEIAHQGSIMKPMFFPKSFRAAAAAIAAGALLIPATAHAAAPWSDPVTVPGSPGQVGEVPQVLFTKLGGTVAWSSPGDGFTNPLLHSDFGQDLAPQPATAWAGSDGFDSRFDSFASAFGLIYVGSDGHRHARVAASPGPDRGWKAQLRGPSTGGARDAAAANGSHAAAVFSTFGKGDIGRVYLVRQNGAGPLEKTQTLSGRGHIRSESVAVNAHGDILVAWDRSGHLEARMWIASSHHLTGVQQLGTTDAAMRIAVALGSDRRAIVAWIDQRIGEGEAAHGKFMATARTATRGFAAARQLDTYGNNQIPGENALRVAYTGAGRGVIAWGGSTAVRSAFVDGRSIGTPVDLAPVAADNDRNDLGLGGLATSSAGQAVVTWVQSSGPGTQTQVMAATLADGASSWGPAETVSPATITAGDPSVAFDPTSNQIVLAWRTLATPGGAPAEIDVVQRAAP
jgi:hypothetical protein